MTTDTELRLTEAERETLRGLGQGQYVAAVERIIVDRAERAEERLAKVERERGEWKTLAHDGAFQQSRAERAEAELAEHAREWRHVGPCDRCTDYPEETCPQHGRTLTDWRDIAGDQIGRANQAEEETERLREGIKALADELHRVDVAMLAGGAGPASMSVRDTVRRLRSLLQEGE